MITYSIIQKSQLEGAERLDAEYYQPEYLQLANKLKRKNTVILGEITSRVTQGPNPIFIDKGKVSLNGRNIKLYRVDLENSNFISEAEFKRYESFRIKQGDILITLKGLGSIGKIGYVFEDIDAIFSRDIGLIRGQKNSEAIFSFLLSKYGVSQVQRSTTGGTGQLTLTTNYIKQFIVPKFDENIVRVLKDLIQRSELENNSSIENYTKAEELLLKELGLKDFQEENDLSYIVNFSDVQNADRIDADYFQTKYAEIIKKIKSRKDGWDTLENLASLIGHPSNPPYANNLLENKTFIITQKHLANYFPADNFWEDSEALYTTDEFMNSNATYLLKENDLILYSVGAYIGKVNIYNSNIKATIGSFLTLIRPKQELINSFSLLVFLNSPVGLLLTRRNSRGLAQQYIYPYDTKTIPIPKLNDSTQREIEKLVKRGQEARKKSKELLEEAKRKVEEMIEKGGEN